MLIKLVITERSLKLFFLTKKAFNENVISVSIFLFTKDWFALNQNIEIFISMIVIKNRTIIYIYGTKLKVMIDVP